jgi:Uma2 family endonuclease
MSEGVRTRRWTRKEYDRLIEIGVFRPDESLELLGGELIVGEPQSSPHYTAIGLVEEALRTALGPGWLVRPHGPLALDEESEPEPDVSLVPGTWRDYTTGHPARPVLVVEVSLSRLTFDREHKGSLYARAGLTDYWILNLVDRILEIYRAPVPAAAARFGWRYSSVDRLSGEATASPLAAPDARVRVSDLLP